MRNPHHPYARAYTAVEARRVDEIKDEIHRERGNDYYFYPQAYLEELIDERYLKRYGKYELMKDINIE